MAEEVDPEAVVLVGVFDQAGDVRHCKDKHFFQSDKKKFREKKCKQKKIYFIIFSSKTKLIFNHAWDVCHWSTKLIFDQACDRRKIKPK